MTHGFRDGGSSDPEAAALGVGRPSAEVLGGAPSTTPVGTAECGSSGMPGPAGAGAQNWAPLPGPAGAGGRTGEGQVGAGGEAAAVLSAGLAGLMGVARVGGTGAAGRSGGMLPLVRGEVGGSVGGGRGDLVGAAVDRGGDPAGIGDGHAEAVPGAEGTSGVGAVAAGGRESVPVASGMSRTAEAGDGADPGCGTAADALDSFPPGCMAPRAGAPDGRGPAGMTQASAGSVLVEGALLWAGVGCTGGGGRSLLVAVGGSVPGVDGSEEPAGTVSEGPAAVPEGDPDRGPCGARIGRVAAGRTGDSPAADAKPSAGAASTTGGCPATTTSGSSGAGNSPAADPEPCTGADAAGGSE